MNKKLFLGMFAAAGMLLATSCSNDELDQVQSSSDQAQVTFSLGLEGGMATRAISDGTGAKKLVCAVYDANDNVIKTISINNTAVNASTGQFVNTNAFQGGLKDKINVTLAKGQEYTMVFWAQNPDCDAYDTDDLTAVKVDYTDGTQTTPAIGDINNDETRDAFYAAETFKVEGNKELNVTLKRPFAQINVGVYKSDWEAAVASGITIAKSSVVIKNAATSINLLTGAVGAETTDVEVSYAANTIPTEDLKVDLNKDGDFYDDNEMYKWLSMSYILVADHDNALDNNGLLGTDKSTLQGLKYTFTPVSGNVIEFEDGLAGAPVRRNWRTNILGKILTGDIQFNITIDPAYEDDYIYPDGSIEQELEYAATFGGTVTLTGPVTLSKTLNVNADMIINLNGQTITGPSEARDADNNRVHAIVNNANLTINGGTITSPADNGGSAIYNNADATLIVNNVEINGAPIVDGGWPSYGINNYGTMTINGAKVNTYHGGIATGGNGITVIEDATVDVGLNTQTKQTSWALYVFDNGQMTVNGGTFKNTKNESGQVYGGGYICAINTSKTIINGGTFDKTEGDNNGTGLYYQCKNLEIKGGVFDTDPSAYVADGYQAVKNGDKWYVVKDDVTIVSNATELKDAVNAGNTSIWMKAGTYDTKDFQFMSKTLTLKGMEDGVKIYNSQNNDVACTSFDMCTVTFENLTIETLGGNYKGFARMNGNYKNCYIVNNYFTCYGKHLFDNCTFNAPTLTGSFKNEHCIWTYGAEEVDFVNCKFNYSDRAVNVYVDNGSNAPGIKSDVEFVNCEFITENTLSEGAVEVNSTPFTAGVKVALENCTAPAYGKLVYVSPWDGTKGKTATITVDGNVIAGLESILNNAIEGSTITLSEDVNLGTVTVGELKNVTIKGAENTVMIFKTDANTKIENVTLQNVNFEYSGATADCGVVIDGNAIIDNLVLEGCTFSGTGAKAGRGLSGLNNNASIVIKDCHFKDLGYPIYAWGGYEELKIEGCTFENIKSWAIMPQSGFDGDLTVTGCTFKDCLGGGLIKAGTLTAGHTFTFTNNTVTGCTIAGDHNWFQFNVSAGTKVISGNTKDGASWTPSVAEGLK